MSEKKKSAKKGGLSFEPERTVRFFIINVILSSIVAMIIWPLMDLLFCAVFTHEEFKYTFGNHIVEPVIFMLLVTVVEFLTWNVWHKDKKTKK